MFSFLFILFPWKAFKTNFLKTFTIFSEGKVHRLLEYLTEEHNLWKDQKNDAKPLIFQFLFTTRFKQIFPPPN